MKGCKHTSVGLVVTAAIAALLVLPAVFTSVAPGEEMGHEPNDASASAQDAETAKEKLTRILNALPAEMNPAVAMGPAAQWLFEETDQGPRMRDAPGNVSQIFDRVRTDTPYERVPIPEPPEGSEPLLIALQAYGDTLGIELPDLPSMRAQIVSLRLQPPAEEALSQLILAYTQAAEIEAEATQGLSAEELLFLHQEPRTVNTWLDEKPLRTDGDVEARVADLAARIDFSDRLRAADLLMRTIEATKDDIGLPPAPLAAPDSMPQDQAVDVAGENPWPATGNASWEQIYRLIGAPRDDQLPEVPDEGLVEALQKLAVTIGAGEVEIPSVDHLPPSLTNAVAKLVTARRIGLESGDALIHTQLLLDATREAEPTLRAWAAVLQLQEDVASKRPYAAGLLAEAMQSSLSPSRLMAEGLAAERPESLTDAQRGQMQVTSGVDGANGAAAGRSEAIKASSLAGLLVQEGLTAEDAAAVATATPPPVAAGVATALAGLQAAEARQDAVYTVLSKQQRAVLDGPPMHLVVADPWSQDEAQSVQDWAEAVQAIGAAGYKEIQAAQLDALAAVEAAVGILSAYVKTVEATRAASDSEQTSDDLPQASSEGMEGLDPLPELTAPMSHTDPLACDEGAPGSDCQEDVWFFTPQGRGILVTGFHDSDIRTAITDGVNPGLIIDLGGDDDYSLAVGAVDGEIPGSARVIMDLGGNDEYASDDELAHGAARGLGTLGVLWDVAGDDTYRHKCLDPADCIGAQGYGAEGGLGLLVDGSGSDTYEASQSWAHGVGLEDFEFQLLPDAGGGISQEEALAWVGHNSPGLVKGHRGIGGLVDLGGGSDILNAERGQGYALGDSALGILVNEAGRNTYETTWGNARFQGGHGVGTSALGLFVDLGGDGTQYNNNQLPAQQVGSTLVYRHHDNGAQERTDDALWMEIAQGSTSGFGAPLRSWLGVGIGLDSSFEDDDEDGLPNAIELLVPSDPDDPADPGTGTLDELQEMLQELIEDPPDDPEELLDSLPDPLFRDDALCWKAACSDPVSLLHIGGPFDDQIDKRALIVIELGGNDTYSTEVAGPGAFFIRGVDSKVPGVGSYALDLSGADQYVTPGASSTQASVNTTLFRGSFANPCTQGGQIADACATPATTAISPVSMLIEMAGNDVYAAGERSQGSIWRVEEGLEVGGPKENWGAAWLLDIQGDDEYTAGKDSQAHTSASGVSGLLDLAGNDRYSFLTQGIATSSIANSLSSVFSMFFDGGGADRYDASRAPKLYDGNEETVFAHQGAGPDDEALFGYGAFIDNGVEQDEYIMIDSVGATVDVSETKNNQTRPRSNNMGLFADAPTWFASDADDDGDGTPLLLEFIFNTDEDNGNDHLGTLLQVPDGPDDLLASDPLLRIPGRLAIFGHGPNTVDEYYPFIVSLGGDDHYTAPFIGGNIPIGKKLGQVDPGNPPQTEYARGATLVLDAGGNDHYFPDPKPCSWEEQPSEWLHPLSDLTVGGEYYLCPTLGATWDGIAVVADVGGTNRFHTEASMDMPWQGKRTVRLMTQGASTNDGIGILATWEASNTFEASLHLDLQQTIPFNYELDVEARGLAQGASEGGLGVLANFGDGTDSYIVDVSASGGKTPSSLSMAQGTSAGGDATGILLDGGGDNRFHAPGGLSQGATTRQGNPGIGILWTGTGDDSFLGGAVSQGASAGSMSILNQDVYSRMGMLHDAGGRDTYTIAGDAGARAASQGASEGAVGILVDVDGNDLYDAPRSTHVQGYGGQGLGALIDGGGHDVYRAHDLAQAVSWTCQDGDCSQTDATGLLVDLHGNDAYVVEGEGQGILQDASCRGSAMFIDTGGTDTYVHSGTKQAPDEQNLGDGETGENDWVWSQNPAGCGPGLGGRGIDSSHIDDTMAALRTLPAGLRGVELKLDESSTQAGGDILVDNTRTLLAEVTIQPTDEQLIRRVTFFHDETPIGDGALVSNSEEESKLIYSIEWDTETVPDGEYSLWASASLDTTRGVDPGAANTPSPPPVQSDSITVHVDNPPEITATVSDDILSSRGGHSLPVPVNVGRDHEWPESIDPAEACSDVGFQQDECDPGAFIQVLAVTESTTRPAFLEPIYLPNGSHTLSFTARQDDDPWPDGWYDLTVQATDARWTTEQPMQAIHVDARPPESAIATPGIAGIRHQATGSSLHLEIAAGDANGTGLAEVCVFRLDPDGKPMSSDAFQNWPQCLPPTTMELMVGGVSTGDMITFAVAARDAAGNLESPCHDDEIYPCILDKIAQGNTTTVQIDFAPPVIDEVLIDGLPPDQAIIRPGDPVIFTAEVTDIGAGVEDVTIRLPGGLDARMTHEDGRYVYDSWHLQKAELFDEPAEQDYAFTVQATDAATNSATPASHWGTLDGVPPRVFPLAGETKYRMPNDDTPRPAGRPGMQAHVKIHVEDVAMAALELEAVEVSDGSPICDPPEARAPTLWECRFFIKQVQDGSYKLPIIARDVAGNVNSTETVRIEVRTQPPLLQKIQAEDVRHDGFRIDWTTPVNATGTVEYGRGEPDNRAAHHGYAQDHAIDVTGLSPSSTYNVRVISENEAGVASNSTTFQVTTKNAYVLDFDDTTGTVVRGDAAFPYHLMSLAGNGSVRIQASIQDAGGVASPFQVAEADASEGPGVIAFDTQAFADGAYRLVIEADRAGDALRVRSQSFHIDNTEPIIIPLYPQPGTTIADTEPTFKAILTDPMGHEPPDADTLVIEDGHGTTIPLEILKDTTSGPSSLQREVWFRLPVQLPTGHYELAAKAGDIAGNSARMNWSFHVDADWPDGHDAKVVPIPGPDLAKPGGSVKVQVQLHDPSGVSSAHVDLGPMMAGRTTQAPLFLSADNEWSSTIDIPLDAQHGSHEIPIIATDALGNQGTASWINISVDSHPVKINRAIVRDVGHTSATIEVRTNKPAHAWTGERTDRNVIWTQDHTLRIEDLRPGQEHQASITAADRAGHEAQVSVSVMTVGDHDPPQPVQELRAASHAEGTVQLTWKPASDDVGLDMYRIHRSAAPRAPEAYFEIPATQTAFRDIDAPAGRETTYTVAAVDLAGNEENTGVDVIVLALPHLTNASISPRHASSQEPVTFSVEYKHAGDKRPDRIIARIGKDTYPLHLEPDSPPCHQGCRYSAQATLEASNLFQGREAVIIVAETDGRSTDIQAGEAPLVVQRDGRVVVDEAADKGEQAAGAGGILALVAVLIAAMLILMHRRRVP